MVDPRYLEWVQASRWLAHVHPMLVDLANGLGILDSRLIEKDARMQEMFPEHTGRIEMPLELEHRTLSLLWVLGAYELIRTLVQRLRENGGQRAEEAAEMLLPTKRMLERVRVPLAKLEKARRATETDFPIGFPVLDGAKGTGWVLRPGEHVPRRALADELLKALNRAGEGVYGLQAAVGAQARSGQKSSALAHRAGSRDAAETPA